MFTIAFLTRRVPGMTRQEFFRHYHETHFPLAIRLPGLVSYQQNRIAHEDDIWTEPESFPDYDALSLYSFESREAADAAFSSPEGQALNEDTGTFMDWPSVLSIPVEHTQRYDGEIA